jgi:hypothetical protein
MSHTRRLSFIPALLLALAASVGAQPIEARKGKDPRVDYAALAKLGPWDDRNYDLTASDLALLAPNEAEQRDPLPAFYRVLLRRQYPELRRSGPAQYPRSAFNRFLQRFRGFQIGGKLYRGVRYENGLFRVETTPQSEVQADADALTGEVRVTSPNGAAESAIAVSPANANLVIAGTNGPTSGQNMHFSTNGGTTWTQAPVLPGNDECCDPTVAWSSDGTKAYAASLASGVTFYRSANGGQTWNDLSGSPARREFSNGGFVDKEYLHVDTFATSPFKDRLYMTWHENNVMQFARSTDQGNTWSTPLAFSSDAQGIGSDIATDRAGNIYYVYPAFSPSKTVRLLKSTNGGTSFAASTTVTATQSDFDWPIPAMETRRAWNYVSVDADLSNGAFADSIYVCFADTTSPDDDGNPSVNHSVIKVAFSRNGGSTWTIVNPHATGDSATVDRFNPWMSVAPNGRINVIYYSTQNSVPRTAVDVYHTFSVNGGVTWSVPERLTAVTSPNITDGFEWGDYNGLSVFNGQAIAIYTDNRVEGGGSGQSVDVYAAGPVVVPVQLETFKVE